MKLTVSVLLLCSCSLSGPGPGHRVQALPALQYRRFSGEKNSQLDQSSLIKGVVYLLHCSGDQGSPLYWDLPAGDTGVGFQTCSTVDVRVILFTETVI